MLPSADIVRRAPPSASVAVKFPDPLSQFGDGQSWPFTGGRTFARCLGRCGVGCASRAEWRLIFTHKLGFSRIASDAESIEQNKPGF
jgi:hypothetical protein